MALVVSRKRARPCATLDDDDVKEEMRILYQVLRWKPEDIATEINKNHNLSVTADDSLLLAGIIDTVSMADLSENIRVSTPKDPEIAMELFSSSRTVLRRIPYSVVYNLPIGQFSRLLARISASFPDSGRQSHENLEVTAHPSRPHLPLIRLIIFRISNNLIRLNISFEFRDDEINDLLDRANELGLRGPLKGLLSINTPSIVVVCEVLQFWFYLRGDLELLKHIRKTHSLTKLDVYTALDRFWRRDTYTWPKVSCHKNSYDSWIERLLVYIDKTNTPPKSEVEARILLAACKRARSDISLFLRLWNRKSFPPHSLEGLISNYEPEKNYVKAPLITGDPSLLRFLLETGFKYPMWILLLRAILSNNLPIAQTYLSHHGLQFNDPMGLLDKPEDLASYSVITIDGMPPDVMAGCLEPKTNAEGVAIYLWDFLDIELFDKIISHCCDELNRYNRYRNVHNMRWKFKAELLVLAACFNPDSIDYICRVLEWYHAQNTFTEIRFPDDYNFKYGHVQRLRHKSADVFMLAVDLIPPLSSTHRYSCELAQILMPDTNQNRILVLKKLLSFGVNPTKTRMWQESVWSMFNAEKTQKRHRSEPGYLKALLDVGADINANVSYDIGSSITFRKWFHPNYGIAYDSLFGAMKPIGVAFFLAEPEPLLLLLEYDAAVDYLSSLEIFCKDKLFICPKFLQALIRRDLNYIKEFWSDRIKVNEIGEAQVKRALRRGDIETALNLAIAFASEYPLLRLEVFIEIIRISLKGRDARSDLHVQNELLNFSRRLLDNNLALEQGWFTTLDRRLSDAYYKLFRELSLRSIRSDKVEILDLLLECGTQLNLQDYASDSYDGMGDIDSLFYYAALYSLRCLKSLVSHGLDINKFIFPPTGPYFWPGPRTGYTALSGAMESGNMDALVFSLQNGADMYHQCKNQSFILYKSAVEVAVVDGRLDAIALFLETDPNCHSLALKAAETTEYHYVAEYVRKWRPGAGSIISDAIILDADSAA
ncbi:hypothetical protein TWF730_003595 [Orbilia blumenaviensis]|uniref:Uncharacterized protein n=1 Tax=Orbilia blumenaviensis TaxID=1796055 RepID=A0AAV9U2W8_9PEZI